MLRAVWFGVPAVVWTLYFFWKGCVRLIQSEWGVWFAGTGAGSLAGWGVAVASQPLASPGGPNPVSQQSCIAWRPGLAARVCSCSMHTAVVV